MGQFLLGLITGEITAFGLVIIMNTRTKTNRRTPVIDPDPFRHLRNWRDR